jgi:hypothetical protein
MANHMWPQSWATQTRKFSTCRKLVLAQEAERHWKVAPTETANVVAFNASELFEILAASWAFRCGASPNSP